MKRLLPFIILLIISLGFFYQSILYGKIPFPGDLLVSEYTPWKYESYSGFNPGSFPNKAQYFDVLQQLYPWRELVVSEIKQGRLPLWNPYSFSGYPLFANIQSSVLNPFNILFFVLPFPTAWSITILLQCFLASLGMYLFTRRIRLAILPSLFTSVAYSYSLFMTVFLEYNTLGYIVALLPICAYAWLLYNEKQTVVRTILFTIFLSSLFFVGHLQLAVVAYLFVAIFAFFFFDKKLRNLRRIATFFIPFTFSILIASIQLIPSFELISLSARVPQNYTFLIEKLLIQPWQLIMIAIPDLFGNPATRNFIPNETYPTKALGVGAVSLLFVIFAMFRWKQSKEIKFFSSVALSMFVLVTLNPLTLLFYKIQIPLFSTSSPSNMIFILSFCLSILAGFGLQRFLEKQDENRDIKKSPIIFLGIVVLLFFLSLSHSSFFHLKNLAFSGTLMFIGVLLVYLGVFRNSLKRIISMVVLFLILGELFFFFQKFNPFVQVSSIYPRLAIVDKLQSLVHSGERVWSFGSARFEANIPAVLRLNSPEGYDPLYPSYYGQLLAASQDGRIPEVFDKATRSNAKISRLTDRSDADRNVRFRLLDILSVRFVLDRVENGSSEKTFPVDRFHPLYRDKGWAIYENTKSLPKAWLASSYTVTPSEQSFQKVFFDQSFPYTKKVTLYEDPGVVLTAKKSNVTEFLSFSNKKLYKSNSDGKAILVFSQTYYPGWRVYVDGEEKKLFRVDHALSGVIVPQGEHDVALFYWPKSFVFGSTLSIIGGIGLILVSFFQKRKNV